MVNLALIISFSLFIHNLIGNLEVRFNIFAIIIILMDQILDIICSLILIIMIFLDFHRFFESFYPLNLHF